MTMKEFAEVIKKSRIVGNNTVKIIQELFKAAGAEEAVSGWSKTSSLSPSPTESTVKKWFNGSRPGVSRYFPTLRIENKERAHGFLLKTPKKEANCLQKLVENVVKFSVSVFMQKSSSVLLWSLRHSLNSSLNSFH